MFIWLHCFPACGEAEASWQKGITEHSYSPHGGRKQRDKEEGFSDKIHTSKMCSPDDLHPPTRLHLLVSTIVQKCHPIVNPSMDEFIDDVVVLVIRSPLKSWQPCPLAHEPFGRALHSQTIRLPLASSDDSD
jgi:hypothetical protein